MLVKDGHGFSLIREGTPLHEDLTTRPIAGVDWTVDTAVIYHKQWRPKTVPLLVRKFKKQYSAGISELGARKPPANVGTLIVDRNGKSKGPSNSPLQLTLLQ